MFAALKSSKYRRYRIVVIISESPRANPSFNSVDVEFHIAVCVHSIIKRYGMIILFALRRCRAFLKET